MPIELPQLDDRSFRALADEAIARIPAHTPEWTNFNAADPGVTLLELFAFMAESLLYRANQIPERNRLKFLQLLGVPLAAARPACGLVCVDNARGPLATFTLPGGEGVRAGALPFRTLHGLDVLPVEAAVVFKRELASPDPAVLAAYQDLYASFGTPGQTPAITLYETVPLADAPGTGPADTVDGALWVALLKRSADRNATVDAVRQAIGGKVLTLGFVQQPEPTPARALLPGRALAQPLPQFEIDIPGASTLGSAREQPVWTTLVPRVSGDGELVPLRLEVSLPEAAGLMSFDDLDPLEAGAGTLPPAFEDPALDARVVLWLRLRTVAQAGGARFAPLWGGINACAVEQREAVLNEALGAGTGAPDQRRRLARGPVVAGSLRLTVGGEAWHETDELYAAPPEVPLADPRLPVNARAHDPAAARVFRLDAEAGELLFGDGLRGARPGVDQAMLADYDVSAGAAGNVAAGAINAGISLPAGFGVGNPVATWGGRDAEQVADGERALQAWLRHRERAVTAEDFRDLALRTPAVELARAEVLTTWALQDAAGQPVEPDGVSRPGAVTVLVVPLRDPRTPEAPRADPLTLRAVCEWLDPARLVSTEVFVTGPRYVGLWIAVGLEPDPGVALADLRERVRTELLAFLSVLPNPAPQARPGRIEDITPGGWPRGTPVLQAQLLAVVSRVPGVRLVHDLLLGADSAATVLPAPRVPLGPIQFPEVLGLSVEARDFADGENPLVALKAATTGRPDAGSGADGAGRARLPVPYVPDQCGC